MKILISLISLCFIMMSCPTNINTEDDQLLGPQSETTKMLDSLKKDGKNTEFVKKYENLAEKIQELNDLIPAREEAPVVAQKNRNPEYDRQQLDKEFEERRAEIREKNRLIDNVTNTQKELLKDILSIKSAKKALESLIETVQKETGEHVNEAQNLLGQTVYISIASIDTVLERIERTIKDSQDLLRMVERGKKLKQKAHEALEAIQKASINIDNKAKKAIQDVKNGMKKLIEDVGTVEDVVDFANKEIASMKLNKSAMVAIKVVTRAQGVSRNAKNILNIAKKTPSLVTDGDETAIKSLINQISNEREAAITASVSLIRTNNVLNQANQKVKKTISASKKTAQYSELLEKRISKIYNSLSSSDMRKASQVKSDMDEEMKELKYSLQELENEEKTMSNS